MGEIRIVGPGKTRGYPYPVCKKGRFIPSKSTPIKTSGYLSCILDISGARLGRIVFYVVSIK